MTYIETLAWGLGLFTFARLMLAPLGYDLSCRYVAAAPEAPPNEHHQLKQAPDTHPLTTYP